MELILIRHALSEDRQEFARKKQPDHLRPLTLKGRKKMQKIAMRLQDFVSELDLIVSSPYTRARQTAEVLSQIFFDIEIKESSDLVPQGHPLAFLKWLKAHARNFKKVVVVGHEPQLSFLASYLLADTNESFFDLKKSGIIFLEIESFAHLQQGQAVLKGFVSPKLFLPT
ncbi:MAG: phosphohistidine phosphatase SixA [Pseudobdellovibrionaceae bacterium]